MDCCKRLLADLAKPEEERDQLMPLALWSSAVLAYGRCFSKGKRFALSNDDVKNLPLHGAVMKFHQWILEERDKLAARAANPAEGAKVTGFSALIRHSMWVRQAAAASGQSASSAAWPLSWPSRRRKRRRSSRTWC